QAPLGQGEGSARGGRVRGRFLSCLAIKLPASRVPFLSPPFSLSVRRISVSGTRVAILPPTRMTASANGVNDPERRRVVSRTVAEHLVDDIAQAGVQRIYGVVGDSLNPVTDAIRRRGTLQ